MKNAKERVIKSEQYYTALSTASDIMSQFVERESVIWNQIDQIIEPSAGGGSFLKALAMHLGNRTVLAYDIEPNDETVAKQDFLQLNLEVHSRHTTLCLGNPPFGVRGSLARKFLNKCTEFSDYILMILPISFKAEAMMSNVNSFFHINWSIDLPVDIWTDTSGKQMARKIKTAAFFISRRDTERPPVKVYSFDMINREADGGWKLISTKTSNQKTNLRTVADIRPSDIGLFLWGNAVDLVREIKDFNSGRYHVIRLLDTPPTKHVLEILRKEYEMVRIEKEKSSTIPGMIAIALPDLLKAVNAAMKKIKN